MILSALFFGVFLPLVTGCVVLLVASRVGSRKGAVGALLAVVAGFLVGNYFREAAPYRIDSERPFALGEWVSEVGYAVSNTLDEENPHPPARYWLPWVAAFAGLVGWMVRAPNVSAAIGWAIRAAVSLFVARLLGPTALRAEHAWLWPVFATAVLWMWGILDALGEDSRGWLPFGIGMVFTAAAIVLIHAHFGKFTDLATVAAGSWFGVALAAWWTRADVRGAIPVAAVMLPGLMLEGQQSTFSEIPASSFVLAALAPLALSPLVIALRLSPALWKRTWLVALVGLLLMAVAAGSAVQFALSAESISLE